MTAETATVDPYQADEFANFFAENILLVFFRYQVLCQNDGTINDMRNGVAAGLFSRKLLVSRPLLRHEDGGLIPFFHQIEKFSDDASGQHLFFFEKSGN